MRAAACLASLGVIALAGCAVGPDYAPPTPVASADYQLTESTGSDAIVVQELPDKWWQLFADPTLDRLVEKALMSNTDVRIASANLQRARALLSQTQAGRLPVTTVSGSANQQQIAGTQPGFPGAIEFDFYSVGFDTSYEIDLFGRVSRSVEAARADLGAATAQRDAARVAIAAETARSYVLACSFAAQAGVARETAALQEKTLDLTQRLLDGGRGTRRDVDRATLLLEQARAQVPQFDAEQRAALYALAVLTGDPPALVDPDAAACAGVPQLASPLPVGDAAGLLARRPDIRQAERVLAGDVARIGVATAQLYPSITLLGGLSLGAGSPGDLASSDAFGYSLGPFISWNFPFNNAARARVRAAGAVADGSLAQFDKAVLLALQETEQSLARLKGAMAREASLARAAEASERAASVSKLRFDYGADSLFQLLDAERERAQARAGSAASRADRAVAQIAVFKALGGGWETAPEPIVRSATNSLPQTEGDPDGNLVTRD